MSRPGTRDRSKRPATGGGCGSYTHGSVKPHAVFKAYDIRGRSDIGELDADLYELAGNAFARLVDAKAIAVGRDCRSSSPGFFDALARGISLAGADVIDLGEVPTDAVYYYSGAHNTPGAMITASHNPAEYNGLKLCRAGAGPVGAETGLAEIKESVLGRRKVTSILSGSTTSIDVIPDYVDHLFSIVTAEEIGPLRVAVDGGNGMAGVALEDVFGRIEASLEGLYIEPDGAFPNHPADPLVPENLADLVELVQTGDFDLGVAFDGDADRAFFLDDTSAPLSGSTVTSLIARRMLSDNPGATVVHNLITSHAVPEIVRESGGIPVRTRVGHSYIKQIMADTDAVFGGEHSGHYYFRDNFRADSGMLAMLFLLSILSEDGRPLSDLRKDVDRYAASGEINFEVVDVEAALQHVEDSVYNAAVDHVDGLTVDYGEEWFNVRPSNTEPLLRLNVEAANSERVDIIVERVWRILEESK